MWILVQDNFFLRHIENQPAPAPIIKDPKINDEINIGTNPLNTVSPIKPGNIKIMLSTKNGFLFFILSERAGKTTAPITPPTNIIPPTIPVLSIIKF